MVSSEKIILSASRRTDIPAFYSDWFIDRLRAGFFYPVNPFNRKVSEKPVSLMSKDILCIAFWSKNPHPIFDHLKWLNKNNYEFYFQYTLNGYDPDLEQGIPYLHQRIDLFKRLAAQIGRERMVWRYDPILISKKYDYRWHMEKFAEISSEIGAFSRKIIISFLDPYCKIRKRLSQFDIAGLEEKKELWNDQSRQMLDEMVRIAGQHSLQFASCSETLPLVDLGINPGACIDKEIITDLTGLQVNSKKDPGQRQECRCLKSIDIGSYNTCKAKCLYCYAV